MAWLSKAATPCLWVLTSNCGLIGRYGRKPTARSTCRPPALWCGAAVGKPPSASVRTNSASTTPKTPFRCRKSPDGREPGYLETVVGSELYQPGPETPSNHAER